VIRLGRDFVGALAYGTFGIIREVHKRMYIEGGMQDDIPMLLTD
jgi:hypothetical protein